MIEDQSFSSPSSWSESWSDSQSLPLYQSPSLSPRSLPPYPTPRMTPSSPKFHTRWTPPQVVGVNELAGSINNSQPPRQIRFVANDGQPHAKRRRITAACKTCRKRKTRCSGEKPECSTCRNIGQKCLGYAESASVSSRANSIDVLKREEVDQQESTSIHHASPPEFIPPTPSSFTGKRPSVDIARGRSSVIDSHSRASSRSHASSYGNYGGAPMSSIQQKSGLGSLPYEIPSPSSSTIARETKSNDTHTRRQRQVNTYIPPSFSEDRYLPNAPIPSKGAALSEAPTHIGIPFYDQNDAKPNSRLVTHLVHSFFANKSSNYPFLQQDSFIRDVDEKLAESILVDAVCSVSANSLRHPLSTNAHSRNQRAIDRRGDLRFSNPVYASFFTRRVTSALTDPSTPPSAAAVHACLLLAYQEFGNDLDGDIWMYLGAAIRIAQELGQQGRKGEYNGLDEIILQSSKELLSKHGPTLVSTYPDESIIAQDEALEFEEQNAARRRPSKASTFPQYTTSSDFPGHATHSQPALSANQSIASFDSFNPPASEAEMLLYLQASYASSTGVNNASLEAYQTDTTPQTAQLQNQSSDYSHHLGFPTFNQGQGNYTFIPGDGGNSVDAMPPFTNATTVSGMPWFQYPSEHASNSFSNGSVHLYQTDDGEVFATPRPTTTSGR